MLYEIDHPSNAMRFASGSTISAVEDEFPYATACPGTRGQPGRRPLRAILCLTVAAVAVAAGSYLGKRYLLPTQVDYQVVQARPLLFDLAAPGILDATGRVTVAARVSGELLTASVDRNDAVTKGELLGQLSPQDRQHAVLAARADAQAAAGAEVELRSQVPSAAAELRRAQAELERRRALSVGGTVARASVQVAETDLERARAEVERLRAALERAALLTAAATANAEAAAARLDETVLRAPADGIVVAREANPGDLVPSGAPVFRLVDPATIVVEARFDEGVLGMLAPGAAAEIRFTADPERPVAGRVLRLHREVDPQTREFTADVVPETLPDSWALGQRASVTVRAEGVAPTLSVAQRYIVRRDGRPGVWLQEGDRARWQPVRLGYPAGAQVAVTAGLAVGDVVLDPAGRYDFQPVALTVAMR